MSPNMEGIPIRLKISYKLLLCLLVFVLVFPQVAISSSLNDKREEAKRIKNQVDALSRELYKITDQYNSAVSKLEIIRADLAKTEKELAVAQVELEKDQKILDVRVKNVYRAGDVHFIEVVLGSKNLYEFLVRADMLNKIGQKDNQLLNEIKAKKQQIEEKKAHLDAQREEQQKLVEALSNQQNEMEANLGKQKSLLSGMEAEVAKLEQEEREARARAEEERQRQILASRSVPTGSSSSSSTTSSIAGFVFPCAGPHSYSNDWGAPRVGHRHQGCDIMAAKGTPAVACVSGVVRTSEGGRQGHAIWLSGDDGNSYFYAHLSGYAVGGGQRVSAGQVIGYVGNTGNASGGAAHIHFEIHPGGGGAINPYPILRAAE